MAIYFVQAGDNGPVKIGFAKDPHTRFNKIQSDNAERLTMVALFDGHVADEAALHEKFAPHHLAREWFSPAVLDDLASVQLPRMPLARTKKERAQFKRDLGKSLTLRDVISIAGGCVQLSRALGIDHTAVVKWKRVPARRLAEVARITGIAPQVLRPDLAEIFAAGASGSGPVTSRHKDTTPKHADANYGFVTGADEAAP